MLVGIKTFLLCYKSVQNLVCCETIFLLECQIGCPKICHPEIWIGIKTEIHFYEIYS